jgi:hypothetical protein
MVRLEVYLTVVTPGYVVRLYWGDTAYEYHAAGNRAVLSPAR